MSSDPTSGQGRPSKGNKLIDGKLIEDKLIDDKSHQPVRLADRAANARSADTNTSSSTEEAPYYQWPPPRDPNMDYGQKTRSPVHALITALPLLMVIAGFTIYFRGESAQTHSLPIQAESIQLSGVFTGLSATSGRHYLWIEQAGITRAIRVREEQVSVLDDLVRGEVLEVKAAPSVHESTTYWALHVEQSGKNYLNESDTSTNP